MSFWFLQAHSSSLPLVLFHVHLASDRVTCLQKQAPGYADALSVNASTIGHSTVLTFMGFERLLRVSREKEWLNVKRKYEVFLGRRRER